MDYLNQPAAVSQYDGTMVLFCGVNAEIPKGTIHTNGSANFNAAATGIRKKTCFSPADHTNCGLDFVEEHNCVLLTYDYKYGMSDWQTALQADGMTELFIIYVGFVLGRTCFAL